MYLQILNQSSYKYSESNSPSSAVARRTNPLKVDIVDISSFTYTWWNHETHYPT